MKKIIFLTIMLIGLSGGKAIALNDNIAITTLPPFLLGEAIDSRVVATHTPIYPRTGDLPVYKAVANVNGNAPSTPSTLGIKKTRIWLKVYEMTLNVYGNRDYNFQYEVQKLCQYTEPYPKTATCTYTPAPLPINAYVWYQASTTLSNDTVVKDRKITHTAKLTPALKASYKDAYPVYSRGIKGEKFNLLFTAATDYSMEGTYLADVQDFVYNGLFTGDHVRKIRRFFNIYLNDFSHKVDISDALTEGCSYDTVQSKKPDNWDDLSGIDVHAYAHITGFRDCAQIGLSQGRIFSTDASDATVHEMLHALIGQGDEYPGSSGNVAGNHPNVYDSEEACIDHAEEFHATKYAASPGCRNLGTLDGKESPYFHWCPESDIMDAGSANLEAEEWAQFYDQINQHDLSAFSTVRSTASTTSTRDPTVNEDAEEVAFDSSASINAKIEEERWEKSQKTISLHLRFKGPAVILERFNIINGVAAPRIFYPELKSDYLVSLLDAQGNILQEFWTQDPRHIADVTSPAQESSFNLRIAWQPNVASFRIQDKEGTILLKEPLLETKTPTRTAP